MPGSVYSKNWFTKVMDSSAAESRKEQKDASRSAKKEEALREQRLRDFCSESKREAPWSSVNSRGSAGGEGNKESAETRWR
ncbi:uncharacterized protein Bfra_003042 [Botrytis fragariae]|uniref:Uncharacterized protein n=1 Tax=Botrytis fragariae TaxID=1964551 RepID=A0A8H6AZR1_9HELO|nr:uncharacterized protein Bfra_003042 [Botrytis fragariae]KAF5876636.1 hypothetical protein Bfra_003042 [Botrytis fragariae]